MTGALEKDEKDRELGAWWQFKVSEPVRIAEPSGTIVGTRWVITWKTVEGKRDVGARFVTMGHQDPKLKTGLVETSA